MTVFHISPIYNRKSILQHGIRPAKVEREEHLARFKEDNCATEDGKAVYTWWDCDLNEKYALDTVFCKIWLDPRNRLQAPVKEEVIDMRPLVDKFLYPHDHMIFDVYAIEVEDLPAWYVHAQPCLSRDIGGHIYNTGYDMPQEYCHEEKVICIFPYTLANPRIVSRVLFSYDNKKYNLKIAPA